MTHRTPIFWERLTLVFSNERRVVEQLPCHVWVQGLVPRFLLPDEIDRRTRGYGRRTSMLPLISRNRIGPVDEGIPFPPVFCLSSADLSIFFPGERPRPLWT